MDYIDLEKRLNRICRSALRENGTKNRIISSGLRSVSQSYCINKGDCFGAEMFDYSECVNGFICDLMQYHSEGMTGHVRYDNLIAECNPTITNEYFFRKHLYRAFNSYLNSLQKRLNRRNEMEIDFSEFRTESLFDVFHKLMINLDEESKCLVLWRVGFIDEDETMFRLGIKRARLFQRWNECRIALLAECKGILSVENDKA